MPNHPQPSLTIPKHRPRTATAHRRSRSDAALCDAAACDASRAAAAALPKALGNFDVAGLVRHMEREKENCNS